MERAISQPIPYFEYRRRLREIAELSWSRMDGVDLMIRNPGFLENLPLRATFVFLPTDDDDWFHPRICRIPAKFGEPGDDLFTWTHGRFEPGKKGRPGGNGEAAKVSSRRPRRNLPSNG